MMNDKGPFPIVVNLEEARAILRRGSGVGIDYSRADAETKALIDAGADILPWPTNFKPRTAQLPRRAGKSHALLMALPWPMLVDRTMHPNKVEAAKAIAAFYMRLPTCGIGWDDLTTPQQGRWTELIQEQQHGL